MLPAFFRNHNFSVEIDQIAGLEAEISRQARVNKEVIGPNTTFSLVLNEARFPSVLTAINAVIIQEATMLTTGIGTLPISPARYRIIKIKAPNRIAEIMLKIRKEVDTLAIFWIELVLLPFLISVSESYACQIKRHYTAAGAGDLSGLVVLFHSDDDFSFGISFVELPERISNLGQLDFHFNSCS